MMMRVLQAGGLTVDYVSQRLDSFTSEMMREPYGMFENFPGVRAGLFINSFKLIDYTKFPLVPTDYKFIFIGRAITEIKASWTAIAAIYDGMPNAAFPLSEKLSEVDQGFSAWSAILAANADIFLKLDYDSVCSNPRSAAREIGAFVNTPTFTFSEIIASAAVDASLYIKR